MSNQSLSELLTDLRPTLKDATGLGIIATVTIAAMATLGPQIATVGLGAALAQFLGGMFGDTIAGPAMDQLLKRDNGELEEAIKQLEAGLTSNSELRADIAQLLKQQEVYTKVTGVALQHHENRIVERLMRAIAAHQEFSPADVVTALNNAYRLDDLHPEIRYLTNLIKDLKHEEGVWDEYIALKIQAQKEGTTPQDDDLKKLTPDKLALIEQEKNAEQDDTDDTDLKTHESIWEIIDKHPRFVLLGVPGAGKTTTIRHLALEMALDRLANPDDVPIPMVLSPSVWDDNLSLHGFVNQTWRSMVADPFGLMNRGDMVMFIDGLNEMGQDRSSKIKELKDWIHGPRAPKRIIITCREDDYTEDLSLDLAQVFTEPMDDDRIDAFVRQYLGNDADAFFQAMTPRRSELANNPYLLRALTIIYKHGEGNELPANDGQLLQQFVRALWKREYDRNTPGWRDLSEVALILASLAYDMLDQKLAKGVDIAYVDGYMDAPLRQIFVRANFLAEENYKVRFYHQLMQEYFASLELIRRATIPRIQSPRFSGYTGHRVATDWDEVVLAAGAITDDADRLVKDVARRDIWLAAECIVKGAEVGLMTRRSIKKKLLNHINAENTVKRTESLRLYWQLAGKEARPYMLDKLDDPSSRVRRLAVRALAEMPDSEVISRIISLIDDKDVQVGETVTKLLQKSNIDSEYIHHVVGYLRSEDSSSRLAAFKLITQADPKSAFPYALSLTNDRDPQVRREVGRFIEDYYSPQMVRFLLDQSGDVSPDVKDKIRGFLKAPDFAGSAPGEYVEAVAADGTTA